MNVLNFLKSKTFLIQLAIAFVIVIVLGFVLVKFLDVKTRHGEEITVPDLSKMQIVIADEKLKELGLELLLLDTVDFRKDMPPFSIVEQDPKAKTTVKDGRKIYVKVNSGGFTDVLIPPFKDKTYRQMSANFKSLGLKEGRKTYRNYIAKDVVLGISINGKSLNAGDKIKKNSTIDFVLGDGEDIFDGTNLGEMPSELEEDPNL
ncbi:MULTISPECIES: PASTA domain-containing protein [Flavobacterium]|uniref:PASTA domain-containing protein n=1 Tax=Flavobacterium jumunjinense TaxID=998845 RepID=A0ABV5GKA7_9FLAO|nr:MULTISPECIES: PASTA domain-containing protein [Flavobacterium]